ncbi:MAG: heme ABC transporter ATP-binding protein CcmA [Candidatus Muproteobacteria bacterium RIFCSPHIGHO2_12_FULL_60_33]|uniref:Heme ABC transporter ATP-binding protein CcmA n=1 Tax=Candidatus Muproteobacteria bacterium RIFCSPLOWO2_01_FULL_60_18 TaxID=1817768 RepID=A0A1F6U2M8_9PROT|nr:MAG: heme ABC transporter ATP-binding protein CcmA [Candidatus Muproteobacteria bacterium RIFCSPLOWO2_01_FULL_60_18]OGI53301.1 MAG: heme ABC transporter ATP-binding protein CcmA [Candidatus Muproteobacteria bacterium RIFCSPHIGHO2_01_60_12]OGI54447.1 MAG: heme ABC transporter ATP-binding protein CcmA [Candidatus Muproteobacteria bacterium RIFCSPHIGHO2_02_FULL_60_13]OGI55088.1 MAG: heme ABC transporter ATP-binding protein CcmA [Candidatus Muproteobacteria bacterium RIFCSPHIGHO2_12_FULL_60_33]
MLEAVDLECVRGDRPLFSHLSFSLEPGELLHVTGANGSGKTTLLRTLCGLTRAHAGEVRWHGTAIHKLGDDFHAQLAYVGHGNGIQGDLTPAENLSVAVSLSGSADIAQIGKTLERLGLAAYHHFPAKILSQGQKRRLALARLVAEHKPLWILDEPLSGLDVDSASLMTTILMEHLAQGGLIIITSHQDINVETKTTLHIRIN